MFSYFSLPISFQLSKLWFEYFGRHTAHRSYVWVHNAFFNWATPALPLNVLWLFLYIAFRWTITELVIRIVREHLFSRPSHISNQKMCCFLHFFPYSKLWCGTTHGTQLCTTPWPTKLPSLSHQISSDYSFILSPQVSIAYPSRLYIGRAPLIYQCLFFGRELLL